MVLTRTDEEDNVREEPQHSNEEIEDSVDEYKKDDLTVDEDDQEKDRADSDVEIHQKHEKKKRLSLEEYYDLEDEDNIVGSNPESKKLKLMEKAGRGSDHGEPSGFSDMDEELGDAEGPQVWDNSGGVEQQEEEEADWDVGDVDNLTDISIDEEVDEIEEDWDIGRREDLINFFVDGELNVAGAAMRQRKEAHNTFSGVDELLMLHEQGLVKTSREKRHEYKFEPFLSSEKYLTEKDYRILDVDLPERMQIAEESTGPGPTDESSLEDECVWIHNQLITSHKSLFTLDENISTTLSMNIKEDIRRFLELTHVKKYDIPFIFMYRKESCPTLLKDPDPEETATRDTRKLKWHKILWSVKDLDRKWLLLQKRKTDLLSYYNKRFEGESCQGYKETGFSLNKHLFESILESLQIAKTEIEVDDVDSKFNLHFPPGEVVVEEGKFRSPTSSSQHTICSKAGIWEVANKIGYSSEKLGMLLNLEKMNIESLDDEQEKETPEDIASNFTCAMFETPEAVLKSARHMAAVEIWCEPRIRKHVRRKYMSEVVVSTTPTPEGNMAIDRFHQFARVKWLRDKPLKEFKDEQWLLIQKAEEEKLLQVTIKIPEDKLDSLINEFAVYYLSHGDSAAANMWNAQRNLVLQDAFFNFLLPSMEKEVRSVLTARSKSWLLMKYGNHLWTKVCVGPYQPRKRKDCKDCKDCSGDEIAVKVMACCWGCGNPATTFVMLDSFGEVVDVSADNHISSLSPNDNDQKHRTDNQQRLIKFIQKHQPQVVVVGSVNLACVCLKNDIYEAVWDMIDKNPREISEDTSELRVEFGDESLPHIYEHSRIALAQLPGHSGVVRRATALGRYLQNPLAMVASLCGPGKEVLSWKLHPLEEFLTPDEKFEMVEQVMVDATNQVGIDINLGAKQEWLSSPLQFVAGLGPRKAASLQNELVRNGVITSRKKLGEVLTKKVLMNAVGFIRIRGNHFLGLLDDTRIHPESYDLAKHMAREALDSYTEDYGFVSSRNSETIDLLDATRTTPEPCELAKRMAKSLLKKVRRYLKKLVIDEYAKYAEETCFTINKKETLHDVKMELLQGFREYRPPYTPPTPTELFHMLTGETEHTLRQGMIVQVTVRKVLTTRAICALESGIPGIILADDYTDMTRPRDLTLELNEGVVLTCKIIGIRAELCQLYLTCKESELERGEDQYLDDMDPYYIPDEASLKSDHKVVAPLKSIKPRMIVHPRFRNISSDEAVEFLSDKEVSESIIHPSDRGSSSLTLTLKVYHGIYSQKDIAESGKSLKIGNDTYEDLDKVMDRYVDPLVTHLKTMVNYSKFRRGTILEVDEFLRNEKSERIAYCLGISDEHPGSFVLCYRRNIIVHHEIISLHPKGFNFRRRIFEDIDRLLAYFQRHIDDLPVPAT